MRVIRNVVFGFVLALTGVAAWAEAPAADRWTPEQKAVLAAWTQHFQNSPDTIEFAQQDDTTWKLKSRRFGYEGTLQVFDVDIHEIAGGRGMSAMATVYLRMQPSLEDLLQGSSAAWMDWQQQNTIFYRNEQGWVDYKTWLDRYNTKHRGDEGGSIWRWLIGPFMALGLALVLLILVVVRVMRVQRLARERMLESRAAERELLDSHRRLVEWRKEDIERQVKAAERAEQQIALLRRIADAVDHSPSSGVIDP
jgi:hypothetical protein